MRLLHDPPFLGATLGAIYDCVLDPARWEGVLADLGALIGARRAFLGVCTVAGEAPRIAAMHNIGTPEEMLRWAPINPIAPLALAWEPDRSMVVSRDVGLESFRASRFYRGYVAPRGDLDGIAFLVTREGEAFGHWLLLTQDDRGRPISDEEAAGLELVAPHVRRAVEISGVLGARRLEAATYRAALDALDAAVLLLDGARRPLHANPRAEAALARGAVLRLRPDGAVAGATEAAERALRRATAPDRSGAAEALVAGTDGEERLLFALRLDGLGGGGDAPTLLVLRHPREDTRNPIAVASRAFGLTPAQVQVLAFLAQGHAPEEIADILGVGVSTVRTHLLALFAKTGTGRQAELVARALSLASPLRGDAGPAVER